MKKKHKKKLRKLSKKIKKLVAPRRPVLNYIIKFEVAEIKKRLDEVHDWVTAKKRAETLEWMEKNVEFPEDTQPDPNASQLPTLPEPVPPTPR